MRQNPRTLIFIMLIICAGFAGLLYIQPANPATKPAILTLQDGKKQTIQVELAQRKEDLERGLMFRTQLPENQGMLFDFPIEKVQQMWMKNTSIALDMLFLDHTGKIIKIVENTVPFSEEIISSDVPCVSVLEVHAGTAKRLGIAVGDDVDHEIFTQ